MPQTIHTPSQRSGSLLLDALLAIAIFGIVASALTGAIFMGQKGTIRGSNRIRAAYIAEEGLSAIRSIRDRTGGFDTIAGRTLGQDDGVELIGASWTVVDSPTWIDSLFERRIIFSSGSSDNERTVTANVEWIEPGRSGSGTLSLSTTVANWRTHPGTTRTADWSQPILTGSLLYSNEANLVSTTLEDVVVSGNYAYAADSGASYGMVVFDVSNVSAPTWVDHASMTYRAYDIALSGTSAYLVTGDNANELVVIDIENPTSVSCCAYTIDLSGNGDARGVAVSGTGLFISRVSDTGPEYYVYDISPDPTHPALITSIETSPTSRNSYAVTVTGSVLMAPYSYIATDYTTEELTVVSLTGSNLVGNGDAPNVSSAQQGLAIVVMNTGAYLGVGGDSACEVFAYSIANKVHNPNAAPSCGGNQAYDLGGDNDGTESANDVAVSTSLQHLFIVSDTVKSGVNSFFHVLDISSVHDISSTSRKIYTGTITSGKEADNGIYYRESDHTAFLVGGTASSPGSDLLILVPTFTYGN